MKKLFILFSVFLTISVSAQVPETLTELKLKINQWIVTNGSKQITATQINQLFNSVANLMNANGLDSARISHDTIFFSRKGGLPAIPIKIPGLSGAEIDPTVSLAVKSITEGNIAAWNAKQNSFSLGSGLYWDGSTVRPRKDSALWNANKLNGNPISATPPTNGQSPIWNGSEYVPGFGNYLPLTFLGNQTVNTSSNDFSITGSTGLFQILQTGSGSFGRFRLDQYGISTAYRDLNTGNYKLLGIGVGNDGIYVMDQVTSLGFMYANNYFTNGSAYDRWIPDWAAVKRAAHDTANILRALIGSGGGSGLQPGDTAAMLNAYLRKVDTAAMLTNYARAQRMIDSLTLVQNRLNLKVNLADTAAMLSPYARANTTTNGLNLKVNIADTAAMLSKYARTQRMIDSLQLVQNRLNLKVNIADTAGMLGGYARLQRMLDSLALVQTRLNLKLNISDSVTRYTTHKALKDSVFKALSGILITTRLEFINDTATTTFYSPDLVGKQLTALFIENYPVGFTERASLYCSFDSSSGKITLINGTFASDDFVYILYRGAPVFLLDGDGNPIQDDQGNYIIIN